MPHAMHANQAQRHPWSLHALWTCQFAEEVWNSGSVYTALHNANASSCIDLVWFAQKKKNPKLRYEQICIVAWALWQRRNHLRIHHSAESSDQLYQRAIELSQDFQHANTASPPAPMWKHANGILLHLESLKLTSTGHYSRINLLQGLELLFGTTKVPWSLLYLGRLLFPTLWK